MTDPITSEEPLDAALDVHPSSIPSVNAFEIVVVAALRAHQLRRGALPRVPGDHKAITIAQMEVAAGKISRIPFTPA